MNFLSKLFGGRREETIEAPEPVPSRRRFLGSVFATGVAAEAFGRAAQKSNPPDLVVERQPPPAPQQQIVVNFPLYSSTGICMTTVPLPDSYRPFPRPAAWGLVVHRSPQK